MMGIGALILILLIPLGMIGFVLGERMERRNEAVGEITSVWGREQSVIGPVLIVPYRYTVKVWRDQAVSGGKVERVEVVESATANAYFLPSRMAVEAKIVPKEVKRGIYRAVIYEGEVELSGAFQRPDFGNLRIEEKNVLWEDAVVTLAIPEMRGVKETMQLGWGDKRIPMAPGVKLKGFSMGVHARVGGLRESEGVIPVKLGMRLNGSGGIRFTPIADENLVRVESGWANPSFQGAFLPDAREVGVEGFKAKWQIAQYGREYAQQWTDQESAGILNPQSVGSSLFGVNFLSGVDSYRNVERAIKYGVLFLVLVFAVFFLFEVLAKLRIHPFQYLLVGVALCLFYLGLLSLSEFVEFSVAYGVAALVTTLMIGFYCFKVLKSGLRTLIVGGLLVGIYGFLYITLQLQDYSLVMGTGGLFVVLAAVFYLTRNIDWYSQDEG